MQIHNPTFCKQANLKNPRSERSYVMKKWAKVLKGIFKKLLDKLR